MRFSVVLAIVFGTVLNSAASAQQGSGAVLESQLRRVLETLGPVWSSDFAQAVQETYPDVDISGMLEMSFRDPEDPCDFHIRIEASSKPVIPVNDTYLTFSSMYVQPLLLYLVGDPNLTQVESVLSALNSFDSQMRDFYQKCLDSDLGSFQFLNPTRAFFPSDEAYQSAVQCFDDCPAQATLADQVGGGALVFPLFHELGHHLAGHVGDDFEKSQEIAADAFAMAVFENGGVPVLFGAMGLLVYSAAFDPHSRDQTQLACRVSIILDRNADGLPSGLLQGFPGALERSTVLVEALRRQSSDLCSG